MRVPGNVRKVKPEEIVVFEEYMDINGRKYNAISVTREGAVIFFDTDKYETTGMPTFFGDERRQHGK